MAPKKPKLAPLKDELRNITTINLIANTTNFIEKSIWASVAILGTIFIYDVMFIQLENWRLTPTLMTKEMRKLSDMPLPSMTFCHKGLQKYGVVEKLANMIDPQKEVPKEVLAIRNEFLKVQFHKINAKLDGTNFCGWLFNLIRDEQEDHPILNSKPFDIQQIMKEDCQNFGTSIRQFGAKIEDFKMELLKNYVYEKIVENRSWNMDTFFKGLNEHLNLEEIDAEDGIASEIRKKINEDNIGSNSYSLLVIGGKSDNYNKLSPVMINVEKDDTIYVEECGNKEGYDFREYPVGDFLNSSLVLCGESDCLLFEKIGHRKINFTSNSKRKYASSIKLNESFLWITGGYHDTYPYQQLNSTEIISTGGATESINLPFTVYGHCMIKYSQNKVLLIGGVQNKTRRSERTWIIDLVDFNFTEGPLLIKGRHNPMCGKMKDKLGNTIIIVVGGQYENLVEVLNTTTMDEWKSGPQLPYKVKRASMITTKDNKILLVGGVTKYGYNDYYEKDLGSMLELSDLTEWKEIDIPKVYNLRDSHLSLIITEAEKNLFCDQKSVAELQFLNMIAKSKNLVQPEFIGTFLHHAILDTIVSGFYKNIEAVIKNLKSLFMINEKDMLLVTNILAMNDFSNVKLFERYDLANERFDFEWFQNCSKDLNTMHEEIQEFEKLKSKDFYFKPSPCLLYNSIPNQCNNYCEWQNMIFKDLSEISAMERFVIPDANIKTKDTGSVIRKISSKLFGENNLKNHSYDFISTNPLALFCKENKQAFQGTEIDGYAAHFCNKTQKIQADVGKCIASNSMFNVIDGKVSVHDNFDTINAGVKDAEHLIMISVDMFGSADDNDFKMMIPRTTHHDFNVQMQIHESKGFPQILYGVNLDEDLRSISLEPGHEYLIELQPYGQMSSEDFKDMSLEKRKCRLMHEIFEDATHPYYTKDNCLYDCHVQKAFNACLCVPWDFSSNMKHARECDLFGRTCFFNKIANFTHTLEGESCSHCEEECDWIQYKRVVKEKLSIKLGNYLRSCNKYICIKQRASPLTEGWCTGSKVMCEYIRDYNNTFSHSILKETVWSAEYYDDGRRKVSSYFKIARNLMSNIIIVRLKYKSSEIEMNKLDVRTTTTDKIANFGGTFGIWAELTGCSLLGFINLIIISFKLLLTTITRFF